MGKLFNSYQADINLDFLHKYCIDKGQMRLMKRGALFQQVDKPSFHIGYVETGCFKYTVHNNVDEKDYITGFAFSGEFVADYPNCLYGKASKVQIESVADSKVYIVDGVAVLRLLTESRK